MLDRKLKVLIVTEDDPLYVIRFFDVFFKEYPRDKIEICAITIDNAFHEPLWKTASRLIRFYGPMNFVRLLGRFVQVKLTRRSIARLAREEGIADLPCTSINDPAYVAAVRSINPDVIMSVCAPEIFKKEILKSARLRCVNIHSGRLPKYRGMMPTFWQLLNGERSATITVHEMVEKLDAGAVLGTHEFQSRERDSLDRIIVGTKREGARLMIRVLLELAAGEDQPERLDMSDADYFSFPKPADVRALRELGHRLL